MSLSPTTQQTLIIAEVGDAPDNRVTTNIVAIWADEAGHANVDPKLQVLYTKRRCIDLLLGYYRGRVDMRTFDHAELKLSQMTGNLAQMRLGVQTEITRLEKKARSSRVGVATPITQVQPISAQDEINRETGPQPAIIDPNDPAYAGSPWEPLTFDAWGDTYP